jgi:hypothetical protein
MGKTFYAGCLPNIAVLHKKPDNRQKSIKKPTVLAMMNDCSLNI